MVAGGWSEFSEFTTLDSVELYDPAAQNGNGAMAAMTPLHKARAQFTASLLPSGKLLMAGGYDENTNLSDVELYDPQGAGGTGSTQAMTGLLVERTEHSAHSLSNGKVIIIGGADQNWDPTDVVELYDPLGAGGAGSTTALAPLGQNRSAHASTLLPDGKILITGGWEAGTWDPVDSVELYDPQGNGGAGSVTTLTSLAAPRAYHKAFLLGNGKVLLIAGIDLDWNAVSSVELYDPSANGGSGSSQALTSLSVARSMFGATLLPNGNILIAGGYDSNWQPVASTELYDPSGAESTTSLTGSGSRAEPSVTLLPDGRAWVYGGRNEYGARSDWAFFSIYSPILFTASGGGGDYTFSLLSGLGTVYSGGLFIPMWPATSSVIRVTDGNGSTQEATALAP